MMLLIADEGLTLDSVRAFRDSLRPQSLVDGGPVTKQFNITSDTSNNNPIENVHVMDALDDNMCRSHGTSSLKRSRQDIGSGFNDGDIFSLLDEDASLGWLNTRQPIPNSDDLNAIRSFPNSDDLNAVRSFSNKDIVRKTANNCIQVFIS